MLVWSLPSPRYPGTYRTQATVTAPTGEARFSLPPPGSQVRDRGRSSATAQAQHHILMHRGDPHQKRAAEILSELLHAELDRTITPNGSGFAKQLDMAVHAPT